MYISDIWCRALVSLQPSGVAVSLSCALVDVSPYVAPTIRVRYVPVENVNLLAGRECQLAGR